MNAKNKTTMRTYAEVAAEVEVGFILNECPRWGTTGTDLVYHATRQAWKAEIARHARAVARALKGAR